MVTPSPLEKYCHLREGSFAEFSTHAFSNSSDNLVAPKGEENSANSHADPEEAFSNLKFNFIKFKT